MPTTDSIRSLILDNDWDAAIEQLIALTRGGDFEDEAVLFVADYKEIEANIRKGIWETDKQNTQRKAIRHQLLTLLRAIDQGHTAPKTAKNKAETPPPNRSTAITLAYQGDPYGCQLLVQITIGGRSCTPLTNPFVLQDVPIGSQTYRISGQINCNLMGSCLVNGSGQISVQPHSTIFLMWRNSGIGLCEVWLANG